jgi:carbon-monoxide dehydrogenase medium subunit
MGGRSEQNPPNRRCIRGGAGGDVERVPLRFGRTATVRSRSLGDQLKSPRFDYVAPTSVEEALTQLAEHGDDAKLLAGGQSLVPLLALRLSAPSALIDLSGVPSLDYIRRENDHVAIGAMTRERTVERSEVVRDLVPLLSVAMPLIGHLAIRNRGTVGGSAAHADPSAEIPAVAIALDADVVVSSSARGERTVTSHDFFQGFFSTSLEPDEALIELRFPVSPPGTGVAFEEATRRHGDFAMVGAAAAVRTENARIVDARIVVIGVSDTPLRRREAEATLAGAEPTTAAFEEAGVLAADSLSPPSDLHGTSAYRTHLVRVLVRRALERAARQSQEGR